ncbi:MAG: hypothetical protein Unbinned4311contig1001_34 [Prokaryotic dsDNA virus sp.]|nr:MAG: hypothetical protein Unbinned4311contig1001_34 [Prokaryotic dsDNA virus sp.]|tara:strand:- start:3745 stop:4362 length:618 start_codon:yes stop_codon:yes gene_type:complete
MNDQQKMEYDIDGVAVIDRYISENKADDLKKSIMLGMDIEGNSRDKIVEADSVGMKRRFKDKVLDALQLIGHCPEIFETYEDVKNTCCEITDKVVVQSPFGKSAITAKLYEGKGAEHGWHCESNGISGILYLTDNMDGQLEYKNSNDNIVGIKAKKGRIVILRGQDVWHRVVPMKTDEQRVSIIFNLYFKGQYHRPANLDEVHYE